VSQVEDRVKASRVNADFDQRVALAPPGDTQTVRIDTRRATWHAGLVPGLTDMPLHEHSGISTALVKWAPCTRFTPHTHPGGEEILVLEGLFQDENGAYPAGSWLRNPRWSRHTPFTGPEGALIYVKTGHLGAELLAPDDAGSGG
jgi:hypothetical protein